MRGTGGPDATRETTVRDYLGSFGFGPEPPKPLTAEEAEAAAEAEGLTLERSEKNATGFKGVSVDQPKGRPRPRHLCYASGGGPRHRPPRGRGGGGHATVPGPRRG